MARKYCTACGYDYPPEKQKRLAEGKSVSCLCPPDFGTANELEPSAAHPGMGFAASFNAERREAAGAQDRTMGVEGFDRYQDLI